MIAVVQRVRRASVEVEAEAEGARREIGAGLLILLGIEGGDSEAEVAWGARKCARLRIFPDGGGKMNRSLQDVRGEALVVSQFTLAGDCRKGNRPSFIRAAPPEEARPLYELFCERLAKEEGVPVKRGVFQAAMQVALVNDGPVTLIVERRPSGGKASAASAGPEA